jgi:hypothetical protein
MIYQPAAATEISIGRGGGQSMHNRKEDRSQRQLFCGYPALLGRLRS